MQRVRHGAQQLTQAGSFGWWFLAKQLGYNQPGRRVSLTRPVSDAQRVEGSDAWVTGQTVFHGTILQGMGGWGGGGVGGGVKWRGWWWTQVPPWLLVLCLVCGWWLLWAQQPEALQPFSRLSNVLHSIQGAACQHKGYHLTQCPCCLLFAGCLGVKYTCFKDACSPGKLGKVRTPCTSLAAR